MYKKNIGSFTRDTELPFVLLRGTTSECDCVLHLRRLHEKFSHPNMYFYRHSGHIPSPVTDFKIVLLYFTLDLKCVRWTVISCSCVTEINVGCTLSGSTSFLVQARHLVRIETDEIRPATDWFFAAPSDLASATYVYGDFWILTDL
jgi:hypothetical protein